MSGSVPPDIALALAEPVQAAQRAGTALVTILERLGDPGLSAEDRAAASMRVALELAAARIGLDAVGDILGAYGLGGRDWPAAQVGQLVVLPPRLRRRYGCERTP